ncbi:hypothetical protein ACA910_010694 [Epithemia clementina (nom. ined.)]
MSFVVMPTAVEAARLLCQEARIVLTSLRGGPPHIARGELAQDLMELRDRIPLDLERHLQNTSSISNNNNNNNNNNRSTTESEEKLSDEHEDPLPQQNLPLVVDPSFLRPSMDYSRPFLAVVTDPRASGPHTAVALQSIRRLLQRNVLPVNEHVTRGILGCKFEQTNAAQDEAVEMAIADVLCLLLQMGGGGGAGGGSSSSSCNHESNSLEPQIIQEAFHTVFVTRNTFLHNSPALGYHLDDVLVQMVQACHGNVPATRVILEFILHQLLHTPLTSMHSSGSGVDDETTSRETQAANDATRVLCLRLVRLALDPWPTGDDIDDDELEKTYQAELLPLIQDDLCLSLLMTGQAIWHHGGNYHGTAGSGGGGGGSGNHSLHLVSPAVLTEICATITYLWNCKPLRPHLMAQFEAIWTGFYTRALALLRRRREPVNAAAYHANLVFDAEVEIILESLVDLFHLHDHSQPVDKYNGGGALETMFVYYDCHLHRSDVAIGLYVELCRACGGIVNEEGFPIAAPSCNNNGNGPPPPSHGSVASSLDDDDLSAASSSGDPTTSLVQVDHPWRPVPAHLKELCAAAIMGSMKSLFRDDTNPHKLSDCNHSASDAAATAKEDNSPGQEVSADQVPNVTTTHLLKKIKSQKRFMRKAARIFNQKSSRGIEFLVDCGLLSEPITPSQVAHFLRHAVVVGLDKAAVGAYLGEAGKSSSKSSSTSAGPPVWERDWFHKECLEAYCGLFCFQEQSVLDSLRMFLAAFRLPGEAQQIDRILQAFADKCAALCQEASTLLSNDPKKASDAAYLLSFSIIMLNTDQHNTNIRADRKMNVHDFVKNNTDYGRDITEPGKELPRDYLVAIYDSIKEEEIRTEGEGADGAMTVERWKDVLRQANAAAAQEALETEQHSSVASATFLHPTQADADDLTELILEHIWKPILSAIGAFWNVSGRFSSGMLADEGQMISPSLSNGGGPNANGGYNQHAVMLGVQGARLGMDISLELLHGVRQLGRVDIFRKVFAWVCDYSGLLQGSTNNSGTSITAALVESVEAQSALLVAVRVSVEIGEDLDMDCWKRLWGILFELRDAHLLPKCLLRESDEDLLRPAQRQEWTVATLKGDMTDIIADEFALGEGKKEKVRQSSSKATSMFSAFGRAIFGVDEPEEHPPVQRRSEPNTGKSGAVIWDELAQSDDEGESWDPEDEGTEDRAQVGTLEAELGEDIAHLSPGAVFEAQLIRENIDIDQQMETPVTGLERAEETNLFQRSPRARLRSRLQHSCHLQGLISDSRYLDDYSIKQWLMALVDLIPIPNSQNIVSGTQPMLIDPSKFSTPSTGKIGMGDRSVSDVSFSTPSFAAVSNWSIPVSPGSEAFAEVLICEIALKNRDRLKILWPGLLQDHYVGRLSKLVTESSSEDPQKIVTPDPGLEKRITGLLRLSVCSTNRDEMASAIISSWKEILPVSQEQKAQSPFKAFHRHLSEGLWRIVSHVDGLLNLDQSGWEGLQALFNWCATRSCSLPQVQAPLTVLDEHDPAVQTYRALHLLLNSPGLESSIPCHLIDCLRTLVAAGDTRHYPQLCMASLDLLQLLNQKKVRLLDDQSAETAELFCTSCWRRIVEAMAEAAEHPRWSNVRQHALSMLTDLFLDRQNSLVPFTHLCKALSEICVPLAGRCIVSMQMGQGSIPSTDELMIEFELCIGLIFKPLRHHLKRGLAGHMESHVYPLWNAVLSVLEELLSPSLPDDGCGLPETLRVTMHDLATEHLQNAVVMLVSTGVLDSPNSDSGISRTTQDAVLRMGISRDSLECWMQVSAESSG